MNSPTTRAAIKRWPKSDDDRVYVHAVLLNDPVHHLGRQTTRLLMLQQEAVELDYWHGAEAMCGRSVRVVYKMPFHLEEDDACPDCKRLMTILRFDPDQYPEQARVIGQRVQAEDERRRLERENRVREQKGARQEVVSFFLGADVADEADEDKQPDLIELLRRDRDDPEPPQMGLASPQDN
jgi:hypothetical protein